MFKFTLVKIFFMACLLDKATSNSFFNPHFMDENIETEEILSTKALEGIEGLILHIINQKINDFKVQALTGPTTPAMIASFSFYDNQTCGNPINFNINLMGKNVGCVKKQETINGFATSSYFKSYYYQGKNIIF